MSRSLKLDCNYHFTLFQVGIIEVLDLVGKNYSGLSDPYVEVEVLGMKKKTRFQKDLTSCVYDDYFYFNFEGWLKERMSIVYLDLWCKILSYCAGQN